MTRRLPNKCPYCQSSELISVYITSEESDEDGYYDSIHIGQCKTCKLIFGDE